MRVFQKPNVIYPEPFDRSDFVETLDGIGAQDERYGGYLPFVVSLSNHFQVYAPPLVRLQAQGIRMPPNRRCLAPPNYVS